MTTASLYLHFTSREHAALIVEQGVLLPCSFIETLDGPAVFAVALEGGEFVPEAQLTRLGRPHTRNCAVLFAARDPDEVYPEEVVWHTDGGLVLEDAVAVDIEDAIAALNKEV